MNDLEKILEDVDDGMPTIHRFGKLILGVAAGFAAKELVGKAYTAAYQCYRAKKAIG